MLRVLILGLLTAAWFSPAPIESGRCTPLCWCTFEKDPARAVAQADAVLEGIALDSLSLMSGLTASDSSGPLEWSRTRVLVDRVWKGELPDTVVVYSGDPGATCTFRFAAKQQYLLFLYRPRSGHWIATPCSLSRRWGESDTIVKALGPILRRRAA